MLADAASTDTEDQAGKPAVDLAAQSRLVQVPACCAAALQYL